MLPDVLIADTHADTRERARGGHRVSRRIDAAHKTEHTLAHSHRGTQRQAGGRPEGHRSLRQTWVRRAPVTVCVQSLNSRQGRPHVCATCAWPLPDPGPVAEYRVSALHRHPVPAVTSLGSRGWPVPTPGTGLERSCGGGPGPGTWTCGVSSTISRPAETTLQLGGSIGWSTQTVQAGLLTH